ncbi:hypothetical protein HDU87_005163 [Geranomyces variabilis]|uniref:IQ motif and ubiquitin-like domain-containing protein n=1 Tax=Geranomyces variabilis TaxID=109894 RepID=A0AAD5TQQ3_9FUNG|nr:hypothetical protein HDU87_005163 [Geranomyces variabilis]
MDNQADSNTLPTEEQTDEVGPSIEASEINEPDAAAVSLPPTSRSQNVGLDEQPRAATATSLVAEESTDSPPKSATSEQASYAGNISVPSEPVTAQIIETDPIADSYGPPVESESAMSETLSTAIANPTDAATAATAPSDLPTTPNDSTAPSNPDGSEAALEHGSDEPSDASQAVVATELESEQKLSDAAEEKGVESDEERELNVDDGPVNEASNEDAGVQNEAEDDAQDGEDRAADDGEVDGELSQGAVDDTSAAAAEPQAVPSVEDELFESTGLRSRLDQWHRKRYWGGFRDRRTDVEYFHADTQTPTPQEIKAAQAPLKFTRESQTKFERHRFAQANREAATQMTRRGCYVTTETDNTMTPRRYTTADENEAFVTSKILMIQCWARRIRALRRVRALREERDRRTRALMEKERRRRELAEKKRRREIESRLHPKSTKDFEVLYNGLETWRQQETIKINAANYSEPARLAALADLLDQEAALIQKIDRLQIVANEENRERKIVRLLDTMSSAKKWRVAKLGTVQVDTPNTIRARELKDLYHALNVPLVSVDERLQILLHVKYTVKEFDCNLTREVVELIDREGDLVSRGREARSMEGLRKRISNLFLQFIQTPEFNPEAAQYQKFPEAGQSWKRDQAVYYCRSCTRYLASTEFYLSTTLTHLGKCKGCTTDENLATSRKDDSVYSDLLKLVRLQEFQRHTKSGVPADPHYNAMSLLQEADMRYIVERVWNRQSAVSGARSLESLVLTRWDPTVELSPWNCILLTKAEAGTHDRAPVPEEQYSEEFARKIAQKHFAAKQHFFQLPAMEKYLRSAYVETGDGRLVPAGSLSLSSF